MSIVRIIFGVIVGGCILAALLVAAARFPTIAAFVVLGTAGGSILFVAYHGLRTGIISARRSRYERSANPLEFWFYVSFYALIGALIVGYSVYRLLDGTA